MGDEITKSELRGLLIPDPRVTFKDTFKPALSTLTESGPRPGVPKPTVDSDMVLQTSGDQGASGDIRLETQYSGHAKNNGGAFLWYNGADTATLKHRGWEPPWTFTGLELLKNPPAAGTNRASNFDVLTTDNGTLIAAGLNPTSSAGVEKPWDLLCWHKTTTAATWTEATIAQDDDLDEGGEIAGPRVDKWSSTAPNAGPALLELPDGRILCFYWVFSFSTTDNKYYQIRVSVSTDAGATWDLFQPLALKTAHTVTTAAGTGANNPGRLRAAYKDGQILLVSTILQNETTGGRTGKGVLGQWASSSLGASFDKIEIWDGTATQSGTQFDLTTRSGQFVLAYVHDPSDQTVEVRKVGSAFQKFSSATAVEVTGAKGAGTRNTAGTVDFIDRAELALTKDPGGNLYICYVRIGDLAPAVHRQTAAITVSYDGGDTWKEVGGNWNSATDTDFGDGDGCFWAANYGLGDSGNLHIRDRPRNIAATWQRGRLVLICNYDETDPGATPGDSQAAPLTETGTYALHMGGYSTLTLGSNAAIIGLERRANYREHWAPFNHPESVGNAWTLTNSGTESASLADDTSDQPYLEITTGDGASSTGERYYDDSNLARTNVLDTVSTTSHKMRIHAEWALDATKGGSVVNNGIAIRFRVGRPGAGEIFSIRFKDDGTVTIYDNNGSSQLFSGTLASVGLDYPAAFRMVTYDRKVALFAQDYVANDTDRVWVKMYESASSELSQAAATGRDCEIRFGHLALGGGSVQNISRWYYVQAGAHNDDFGPVCAVPQVNDWIDFTSPDDLGPRYFSGNALYVDDGVKIAAKDGPTAHGDLWKIQTRYDYGIENVHHEIAASPYKTWRSTATDTELLIRWDVDDNAAARTPGAVLGLYLGNINFRHCVLQGYDHNGTWQDLVEIDTRTEVHYVRNGNTVTADTAQTTHVSPHFHTYNSLAGSHFVFNPAAGGADPDPFPILSNSEGVFTNAIGSAFSKRPILRLDGDVSSMPASGDGEIWAQNVLALVHISNTNTYQRFRLKIPTTMPGSSTLNGTFDGYWEIGSLILGHVAVFGRQYSRGHIRQLSTNADLQTQRGGTRRATRLGRARRSVEFAWADSVDLTQMQEASPAPDYLKAKDASAYDPAATTADTAFLMEGLIGSLDGPVTPVVYVPKMAQATGSTTTELILDPNRMLYGRIVSDRFRIENVLGDEWADEVVTASAVRIDEEV
jgi:hypothetical protein